MSQKLLGVSQKYSLERIGGEVVNSLAHEIMNGIVHEVGGKLDGNWSGIHQGTGQSASQGADYGVSRELAVELVVKTHRDWLTILRCDRVPGSCYGLEGNF